MTTENRTDIAIIQIAPAGDLAVIQLYEEALKLLHFAQSRVITKNDDLTPATEDLSFIAKLKKSIEEKRKEYVTPIREHLDKVNSAFKEFVLPLDQADQLTRSKIMDFRQEQERKRREAEAIEAEKLALAKREAALKGGEITVDLTPVEKPEALPSKVQTDMGTAGTMKVWKFEIVDFTLLPNDYKLPDAVKIRKVITAGVSIPGVKAWQEETLRINTR